MFSLKQLAGGLLFRRLSRDLHRVAEALDRQNALLTRLADAVAPADPHTDVDVVKADTGLSHLDQAEAGLALDFVDKVYRQTGHHPDEEEVLSFLADEKTHDLHQRLAEREQQLARLAAEARW